MPPRGGLDPEPARADQVVQLAGVPGQPEEPVLLRDQLRLCPVFRAAAAWQVGGPVELLAADAVPPLVVPQVEVPAGRAGTPEPLHAGPVPRVAAGADEVVERQGKRLAQRGERGGVAVDQRRGRDPFRRGGQHVLERVVVGAGLQPDLVAGPAVVPGQHVALDQFQREAEVGGRVDVGDRGGKENALRVHRNLPRWAGLRLPDMNRGPWGPRVGRRPGSVKWPR